MHTHWDKQTTPHDIDGVRQKCHTRWEYSEHGKNYANSDASGSGECENKTPCRV